MYSFTVKLHKFSAL